VSFDAIHLMSSLDLGMNRRHGVRAAQWFDLEGEKGKEK
jgi:hypothetical protein